MKFSNCAKAFALTSALAFATPTLADGGFQSSNDSWGSSQSDWGVPASSSSGGVSGNLSNSGGWLAGSGGFTQTNTSADGNYGAGGYGTEAGSSAASIISSKGAGKANGKFDSQTKIGNSGAASSVNGAGESWANTTTVNGGFATEGGNGGTIAGGVFAAQSSTDVDDGDAWSEAGGSGKASSQVNPGGNGSAKSSLGTYSTSNSSGNGSTQASSGGALGSASGNNNGGGGAGSFGGSSTNASTSGNGQANSNSSSSSSASSAF